MSQTQEADSEDILRILVATDNHLGYAEKDSIRGEDSFIAFEEILEKAVELDVDFILLGGDLFHDAVPSQNTLHRCMMLLRRYTFGNKPISIECLGDQELNFHNAVNQSVNYEDPNLNVSIPVFSIHGNHDDPSGFGRLSSLDLLSTTGLVNYFGRWTDLKRVEINPLLLRKGQTWLALYGLSHLHDGRLTRLFEDHKVKFNCPESKDDQDWFHLLVLHQNRYPRGPKNFIPEEVLPDILHLVVWGHEHDCHIVPEYNHKQKFFVSQPGSSVATSIAEGEALPKHVALLEIHKTRFKLEPLPLRTVRPLLFESVNLADMTEELHLDEGDSSNKVRDWAKQRVESMIERAKGMLSGHPKQPKLPLVRLRLMYSNEEQMFNHIRFGQMYNDQVANPADVILFKKVKKVFTKTEGATIDKEAMDAAFESMEINVNTRIEELVDRYFETVDKQKGLQVMPTKALSEMLFRLVERRDNTAAENIIKYCKERAVKQLMETLPQDNAIDEQLDIVKTQVKHDDILKMLDESGAGNVNSINGNASSASTSARGKKVNTSKASNDVSVGVDVDAEITAPIKTTAATRGAGRGRGRGGRNTNTTATSPSKRGGSTSRSGRTMPQLDVSINTTRSTRQSTLLTAIEQNKSARGGRKRPTIIEVSDSDD